MIKLKIVPLLLTLALIGIACQKQKSTVSPKNELPETQISINEQQLVQSANTFGLDLFREIAGAETDANIFISPFSVSMALGMTMNGAAAETYEAMRSTLGFADFSEDSINTVYRQLYDKLQLVDEKVLFEIANSIWCRQGFAVEPSFLETNQLYFNAEIANLDFSDPAAVDIINDWVKLNTHEKIAKILDNISWDTVMFLINAIYFKGDWSYQFDKDFTREENFNNQQPLEANCQMMYVTGNFGHYLDEEVEIVDLPYGDGSFSMTVFLPAYGHSVDDFIQNLDDDNWNSYLSKLESDSGTVGLPKFKLEYERKLNDDLQAMGMGIAFDSGLADFSRINPLQQLFISFVKHKTFIQVDEIGTEAAAVTIVAVELTSGGGPSIFQMVCNRPYVYVIREHASNTILFIGKMYQPEWTE